MRDMIMWRYDQELLGVPLWCTTQQEGLWIQGVNVMVPQRRVFVCESELALDESLSMIGAAGELDYFSAHIRLREPDKSKDKAELMQECSSKEQSRQYVVLYLFYSKEQATKVMEKTVQS
ncbi:hypothetical protein GW17_00056882 [Ensete ventricosum]|nr:hypothetical protein GW17_00056882 [Ensete ventricosum]